MKRETAKKIIYFILILSIIYPLCAIRYCYGDVAISPDAGTTSATFLKYGIGSRAIAMGGAFGGLADDMTALYWNPAGLSQLQTSEVSITHDESFQGIRHDFIGYAFPYKGGMLAAGIYGLYTPTDIERRSGLSENDPYYPISPVEGLFQAYDVAAHVSYARWFGNNLSLGASFKYIQETIDVYNAWGVAVDLGSFYKFKKLPLSVGLSVQNIGTPIKFLSQAYSLPLNFRLGSAYKFNKKATATLDFNLPNDNYMSVAAGAEFYPVELFALRAGYSYRINGNDLGDTFGFSAGIGFNFKLKNTLLKVDYAFVPYSVLGNSQRITIGMAFGKVAPAAIAPAPQQGQAQNTPAAKLTSQPSIPNVPIAPAKHELNAKDYNMFPVTTSIRRRLIGGRVPVYILTGRTSASDIVSLGGTLSYSVKGLQIEIGERKGVDNVYKHFIIKPNITVPASKVFINIRVPKNLTNPVVITEEGVKIDSNKESEEADYAYYEFHMDTFKPFRIESQTTQINNK